MGVSKISETKHVSNHSYYLYHFSCFSCCECIYELSSANLYFFAFPSRLSLHIIFDFL
ncbi:LIM domain-containing protein [Paenibacillus alvei]|uniref:LIM domain-containing protein n=1 Tax=Paenibacillus alvei TaxID=44250 RepID=UPI003990D4D9